MGSGGCGCFFEVYVVGFFVVVLGVGLFILNEIAMCKIKKVCFSEFGYRR